jgi:hypothetical protein
VDKTACIVKWKVFISNGAGNLPISSPNRVLLYLINPKTKKKHHPLIKRKIKKMNKKRKGR